MPRRILSGRVDRHNRDAVPELLVCKAIQPSTHAPERPGASPIIPDVWDGSRSTFEVIHGRCAANRSH